MLTVMSKIHHTCNCIGRSFTFEEWGEYCREKSSSDPVMQNGSFKWNINDVCLTPNVSLRIQTRFCSLTVETAQSPNGRWSYGYILNLHNEGNLSPVVFVSRNDRGYSSEEECVYECITKAERRTTEKIKELQRRGDIECDEPGVKEPKSSELVSVTKAFLNELERRKEYYDPRQLRLF